MTRFGRLFKLDLEQLYANMVSEHLLGVTVREFLDLYDEVREELVRVASADVFVRDDYVPLRMCFLGICRILEHLDENFLRELSMSEYLETQLESRLTLRPRIQFLKVLPLKQISGKSSEELCLQSPSAVGSLDTPLWFNQLTNTYVWGNTLEEALGVSHLRDVVRDSWVTVDSCPMRNRVWITERGNVIMCDRPTMHLASTVFEPGVVRSVFCGHTFEADIVTCTDKVIVCRSIREVLKGAS